VSLTETKLSLQKGQFENF